MGSGQAPSATRGSVPHRGLPGRGRSPPLKAALELYRDPGNRQGEARPTRLTAELDAITGRDLPRKGTDFPR